MREWVAERGWKVGAIVSPQTVFALGRDWYATRLRRDWERASPREARAVFARHGLTDAFWSLD